MTTNNTQPARGTRDFLPADVRRRTYVIDIVRAVYERYGFEPLETPAFENIETLLGKYGDEGNQLIFKILKRGEHEASGAADLALRYDLTVPLARVVAQYQNELPRYFKRYQIQPVWRADRPARGRFREFYQCDVDAVGSTSAIVEIEVLSAVTDVLTTLGFTDFVIRLNHRRLLAALLDSAAIPAGKHNDALIAIDKLDKIGNDGVMADLAARGIEAAAAARLLASFAVRGDEALPALQTMLEDHEAGSHAVREIGEIVQLAASTPAGAHLQLDPSLARGLSYYTGAIMEIAVPGIGSLGGGGRYDNLVGMFLGRDVPACGFSLGLERIFVVMTERNMFPASVGHGAVDAVVTFLDDPSRPEALGFASELRRRGVRADVFPEASRKFDKPLKYASARGARAMAIFGENERARGEVSIRNLDTREQHAVPRAEAADRVSQLLNHRDAHPAPSHPAP
ncbi:MAG TPA: histidine--tRNA ligase [Vicinamibacterales bacterium]|nr:histidine--tRNA ligase [Vicinamibacterales bacterium]